MNTQTRARIDRVRATAIGSIPELFDERVRRSPEATAYHQYNPQTLSWQQFSWRTVAERAGLWRAAFARMGMSNGERVAILHRNSVEWVCFDIAALGMGLVTVPLNLNAGAHRWSEQLADTACRMLLVGSQQDWQALKIFGDRFPSLQTVVLLEKPEKPDRGTIMLPDWLAAQPVAARHDLKPDDLATITFTSGTTGRAKGVMLSHRNMMLAFDGTLERTAGYTTDVFLSFLPVSHIYARTTEYYLAIACGAEIAFARSVKNLPEDFQMIRPTVLFAVPRVYERLWKAIVETASSNPFSRWLMQAAIDLGSRSSDAVPFKSLKRFLIRKLVTPKLLARFGGRLRMAVSGGAPLSRELAATLQVIGLPLVEGYGMAETAGAVSADTVDDYMPGSVGRPFDGIEIKIAPSGEILVRSDTVMRGYWKRPEQTSEVLDPDGWLHTGDFGTYRDGRLYIHGRVRDIIVLSTGEKVAPSDLESRIISGPLIEQAVVVGDNHPILAALVRLDADRWQKLAASKGLDAARPNTPECERLILDHIAERCQIFPNFAQIRRVMVVSEPWKIETGELTVTLKVKRNVIIERYKSEIAQLFAGHS